MVKGYRTGYRYLHDNFTTICESAACPTVEIKFIFHARSAASNIHGHKGHATVPVRCQIEIFAIRHGQPFRVLTVRKTPHASTNIGYYTIRELRDRKMLRRYVIIVL